MANPRGVMRKRLVTASVRWALILTAPDFAQTITDGDTIKLNGTT